MAAEFTRGEIEEFLIHEAALLDEWRLEEWLALMAPDARYLVPPLDAPDADHRDTLFLIADDRRTLASRVRQLLSGTTWAENPRSRTRRLITNVRVLAAEAGEARATANFAVWRIQHEQTDVYVGQYRHVLVRGPSGLLFRERARCSTSKPCARTASSASSSDPGSPGRALRLPGRTRSVPPARRPAISARSAAASCVRNVPCSSGTGRDRG
jgi:p-cumate 2,3-dioxygenase subunit beta